MFKNDCKDLQENKHNVPLKYVSVPPRNPVKGANIGHFVEGASIEMEPVYKRSNIPRAGSGDSSLAPSALLLTL